MRFISVMIFIAFMVLSCNVTVNQSIRVKDGEVRNTGLTTVNGNISIGKDCEIHGTSRAINGSIEVGANSIVEDLQTVNGRIDIDENVHVRGNIASINGPVTCRNGSRIEHEISTVNGRIQLRNSKVLGYLKSVNGDFFLEDGTVVEGNIIVEGESEKGRVEIRIREKSIVKGDILVNPERRDVTVYISEGAVVEGQIENARTVHEGL